MAIFTITACQNKDEYTVTGTFPNNDRNGQSVYLFEADTPFVQNYFLDSTIIENGKFVFDEITPGYPVVQFIEMPDQSFDPVLIIAERGKIEIHFNTGSEPCLA